jgi:ubiquinone/menaquinone biosynthesis C-methylase UbiE
MGESHSFRCGSVNDIELPSQKFDGVFVCFVLRHVLEWRKALKEINRVLKPGGILLVEEASKKNCRLDRALSRGISSKRVKI